MALSLVVVLAGIGARTAAVAHSHEHSGSHQIHLLDDDRRCHDHVEIDHQQDRDNGEPNAPEYSEAGFHFHSSPQFDHTDSALLLAVMLTSGRANSPEPDGFVSLHRDRPPFKPPRTIL